MEKLLPGCESACDGYKNAIKLVEKAVQRADQTAPQKAVLTFTDNLDGTLGISMTFEPEVSDETRSGAVRCAISCMDYIVARLDRG